MTPFETAHRVAARFDFPLVGEPEWFLRRGNINLDAFLLTGERGERALMQRISPMVFSDPARVVGNMTRAIEAQRSAPLPPTWRVPDLIPAREGGYTVQDEGAWRLMTFLEGTVSEKRLSAMGRTEGLRAARECGRGLALYLDGTASLDPADLRPSLPGYRESRIYLDQFDAAAAGLRDGFPLPDDPEVRRSCAGHFAVALSDDEHRARRRDPEVEDAVAFVREHRALLVELADLRASGAIADRAIHGDTKLENFLFDAATGEAVALVDLDTVMAGTWLVDWGDMARSLCNVAGEAERDRDAVRVDESVYAACADGLLTTMTTATEFEKRLMPRAVASIALELGVRFLADYLRGDTYFALGPGDEADLNRVRGLGQLSLAARLLEMLPWAESLVGGSPATSPRDERRNLAGEWVG